VERVISFMTLHEFFDLFFTILHHLKDKLINEVITQECSIKLREEIISLLGDLYSQDVRIHKQIKVSHIEPFTVPSFDELRKQVASYACSLLFNYLSLHVFYEVLSNILLERRVLFVSENLNLLTSAVYSTIIRIGLGVIHFCIRLGGSSFWFLWLLGLVKIS